MKLEVEFNNQSKSPVRKDIFARGISRAIELGGLEFLKKRNITVSLALVDSGEIRRLNRTYRKNNSVTDVLSFSEYKNTAEIRKIKDKKIFLGEIILCYNDIKKYSAKQKINFSEELVRVAAHGALHLLGFRHGKKMFEIQKEAAGMYRESKIKK